MSTGSRRHHYVPAFYLRRFADQKGQLDSWRRVEKKRTRVSVHNAAVEMGLYEVIGSEGEPTNLPEEVIAGIEAQVAPGFDALVNGPWPPETETRGLIANFIALQIVRTRESMHTFSAIAESIARLGLAAVPREQWREVYIETEGHEPTEDEIDELVRDAQDDEAYRITPPNNDLIEAMFQSAASLVQPIASRKWFLQASKKPLIATTDSPVHLWSKPGGPYGVGVFTADEIWLPIDSHHNLLMVCDSKGFPELKVQIPPRQASDLSQRLVNSSYEWAFADPRSKLLDKLALPKGPRPLGIGGTGKPLWGPGHEER